MKRMALLSILFFIPTISFSESNSKKELWDKVGIELKKPLWGNYLKVKKVREGSSAEIGGLKRGDRFERTDLFTANLNADNADRVLVTFDIGVNKSAKGVKNLEEFEQLLIEYIKFVDWPYVHGAYINLSRASSKGYLVIYGSNRYRGIGASFNWNKEKGIYIDMVIKDSPVDCAGLQIGDQAIAIKLEDVWFNSLEDFINQAKSKNPGTDVRMVIQRDKTKLIFNLKTGWILTEPNVIVVLFK